MRKNLLSRSARSALTLMVALTLLAPVVSAADFFAIVDSFGKRPRNAYLDVSVDSLVGPVEVVFHAFDAQGGQTTFSSVTDLNGFGTTSAFGNLFELAAGQPMPIRARTPNIISAATLYIDSQGGPATIAIPPIRRFSDSGPLAMGTYFQIALGIFRSASLLIGNVSGAAQLADVFAGSRGPMGGGIYTNGFLNMNSIWKVNLSQNEARSNLVVTATPPIIVQAVIDDGRTVQCFMIMPIT